MKHPDVPADGKVHSQIESVPVYMARCSSCEGVISIPSFGKDYGESRVREWIENHWCVPPEEP